MRSCMRSTVVCITGAAVLHDIAHLCHHFSCRCWCACSMQASTAAVRHLGCGVKAHSQGTRQRMSTAWVQRVQVRCKLPASYLPNSTYEPSVKEPRISLCLQRRHVLWIMCSVGSWLVWCTCHLPRQSRILVRFCMHTCTASILIVRG